MPGLDRKTKKIIVVKITNGTLMKGIAIGVLCVLLFQVGHSVFCQLR